MPRDVFRKATAEKFKAAGLKKGFYEMGTDVDYDLWAEHLPHDLADIFDISITAARIRLKKLNIIREKDYNHCLKINKNFES